MEEQAQDCEVALCDQLLRDALITLHYPLGWGADNPDASTTRMTTIALYLGFPGRAEMGRRRRFSISLAMIVGTRRRPFLLLWLRHVACLMRLSSWILVRSTEQEKLHVRSVLPSSSSNGAMTFSAARNVAFSHCNCDYIFWLDADETVSRRAKRRLAHLLNAMKEDNIVYLFNQVSHRLDGFIGYNVVLRPRLLPNRFKDTGTVGYTSGFCQLWECLVSA